jgi:hypothetical protein
LRIPRPANGRAYWREAEVQSTAKHPSVFVKADGINWISALVDQIPVFIPLSQFSGRFGEISGLRIQPRWIMRHNSPFSALPE